jgi:hypothetical protein
LSAELYSPPLAHLDDLSGPHRSRRWLWRWVPRRIWHERRPFFVGVVAIDYIEPPLCERCRLPREIRELRIFIIRIGTVQRYPDSGACPHDPSWRQLYELTGIDVCALVNRSAKSSKSSAAKKPTRSRFLIRRTSLGRRARRPLGKARACPSEPSLPTQLWRLPLRTPSGCDWMRVGQGETAMRNLESWRNAPRWRAVRRRPLKSHLRMCRR